MSSSQPFLPSSPISLSAGHRRKSRFTYKQLSQLSLSSTSCPLRIIAHIDLDAFYAQVEGVRLGIAEDQPLAVQVRMRVQWVLRVELTCALAVARPHCNQLPREEIRHEQVCKYYRSEEAMSGIDHATCRYVEGRG